MQLPPQKILCSTDFSEPSYDGVKAANELAKYFSAELVVVHVMSSIPIVAAEPTGAQLPMVMKEIEDTSRASLTKVENERISKEIKSKVMLLRGSPADEIVRAATDENVDLIVIATHGQSGLKRWITGSVAERVVRMADRPVLTIHSQDQDES
jgi:nucleotide-binding universal stress UspA family protein